MSEEKYCNQHKEYGFRLKALEEAVKQIKTMMWWFNTLAFSNLIAIVIFLITKAVFK